MGLRSELETQPSRRTKDQGFRSKTNNVRVRPVLQHRVLRKRKNQEPHSVAHDVSNLFCERNSKQRGREGPGG